MHSQPNRMATQGCPVGWVMTKDLSNIYITLRYDIVMILALGGCMDARKWVRFADGSTRILETNQDSES